MSSTEVFEAPDPEELSKIIPGFTVGHLLSKNTDSAVYSAIQTSLDRQVALRIYSPAASSDEARVRAVGATTKAMARLKHRNLIGLFDSGTREGMMYVVMEFVAGKPLTRSLAGGPVHHAQVRSIITGVCEGLAHAHQNQIAHGRLTSDSILLNPDAEPKIGGFLGGDFEKGKEEDVIAVGRLLYLMLTGVEDSPRSVEPSVLAGSPQDLDEIWFRCTQRDRKDAFSSMQEIADILTKPRTMKAGASPTPAAVGGAVKSAASPKAPTTTTISGSSQWPLIRNLVLIVLLVIAIIKVWGMTQRKEREIQQAHKAAQERAAQERERRYQEALAKSGHKPAKRPPKGKRSQGDPGQGKDDLAREVPLEEARASLAAGKRNVMPIGSVRRADSAYLLVKETLTWPEACWFAEQHGAHLAVPDESADLLWLQSIAHGEPFWLGVGRSGKTSWQGLDGEDWQPEKEPAGVGRFIAVDKFGFLRGAGDQVQLAFILQWRMNGSNPGSLEEVLARTVASLSSNEPVYPPGTDFLEDKRYFLVSRDVDWAEARRLADIGGGHLVTMGDVSETVHIQDIARNLAPEKPHWVGAHRVSNKWAWVTKEPWKGFRVSKESKEGEVALAVSSDSGWHTLPVSGKASGFIIEWDIAGQGQGNDPEKSKSGTDQPANAAIGDSMGILNAQAARLVKTALEKRDEGLKANATKMKNDLDMCLRRMSTMLQRRWKENIEDLKAQIEEDRVPEDADAISTPMTKEMADVAKNSASRQKQIDEAFAESANQVREAYQKRLRDIMTKALEKNDRQTVLDLKPRLDASEDLDSWMEDLDLDSGD